MANPLLINRFDPSLLFSRTRLKNISKLGILMFWWVHINAQGAAEVYLTDVDMVDGSIKISSLKNISENPGYDNQPSFPDDQSLLYTRTRKGQTDIALYSLEDGKTDWLTNTPGGSEYSPLKIPGRKRFSAIRLDTTGLQRLYSYPMTGGDPKLLVRELKVGYHLWYQDDLLVCTVLTASGMDLVVVNFQEDTRYTFLKGVGRSLHRIPNTDLFSYISLKEDRAVVRSMNPHSGVNERIIELPEGVQDVCWFPDGTLLCGQGNKLFGFHPERDERWKLLHEFAQEFGSITRLAIHPSGTRLALVAQIETN